MRGARRWTGDAPAKVNLFLRVMAREEGGHHQLETLFQALELADEVELALDGTGGDVSLRVEGVEPGALGPPESNLAVRAARLLSDRVFGDPDRAPGLHIRLRKRIPHGAGLGGGSSDAATVLRGMNELLGDAVSQEELVALGGRLGADVAFFLCGSTLALAWGRGDRLLPLPGLPTAEVLLALPPWGIATPEAYAALARARRAADASPPGARSFEPGRAPWTSWTAVAGDAGNAFEPALFPLHPELPRIRDALVAAGSRPALLSGSGSALFGIHPAPDTPPDDVADRVIEGAGVRGLRVLRTRTRSGPDSPPPG